MDDSVHLQDVSVEATDYYAFLNLRKDATIEDITNAYRRCSRMYHPDRHVDPALKKQAEHFFNKTRVAFEVLSDPRKRAIYDAVGEEGLQVAGWEMVERHYSADDIRLEYERLRKLKEEQDLQQVTNPAGKLTMTVNASDVFIRLSRERDDDDEDYYGLDFPYVEVQGLSIAQSIEAPLTSSDRLVMGGSLDTKNGTGVGSVSLTWRRLINAKMWSETQVALGGDSSCSGSFRLMRTFSPFMHGSAQIYGGIARSGAVKPGIALALTRQLAKRVSSTINLKLGAQNNVTTSVAFDDGHTHRGVCALVVGVPAMFALGSYSYSFGENDARAKLTVKYGNIGAILEASYDRTFSTHNSIGVSCRIHLPRGVTVKLRLSRASQLYQLNVILCEEEVLIPAIVWGVVMPLVTYNVVKAFAEPWMERRRIRQIMEQQRNSKEFTDAKLREALEAIELMRDSADRNRTIEEQKKGLVIVAAWYGIVPKDSIPDVVQNNKLIDVSVPLQTLVKDSKLILYETSKASLAGFYDPCLGEEKQLKVIYRFREQMHSVVIRDAEPLLIPKQSHHIKQNGKSHANGPSGASNS